MAVAFGSDLSSANTNNAFMDKNVDTFTTGKADFQNVTDSTSTITGSIKTAGGLGVAKKAYLQQAFIPSLSGQFVLTSSATKEVVESGVTDVEIEYVSGVTSPIQTQLDSKATDANVVHKTGIETIAGVKTFSDDTNLQGDVVIDGDLTVNGTTTTVNSATLDVTDQNITVNNLGNDATAEGAGLTVDRTGTSGSLVYQNALASKWKAGALGSESEVMTVGTTQTVSGSKDFSKVNINSELTKTEFIDSTSTGAGAIVNTMAPVIRLTNASLVSINNFDDVLPGKEVVITNNTTGMITLINDAGGTAINRILTGTGADLDIENDASLIISYDSNVSRWRVIGGTGSGGGGGGGAAIVATYSQTSGQSIPNSTVTIVDYATSVYDTNSYVTTGGSWKFQPTSAGYYFIKGKVTYGSSATGQRNMYIYKNGAEISDSEIVPSGTSSTTAVVAGVVFLNGSTDYADIRTNQNSGGAQVLSGSDPYNRVEIFKISGGGGGGGATQQVEYRTLSSGEATAKALVLSLAPLYPTQVLVDIIGGGAQEYSVDYTMSGSTLDWSGLGLDGVLTTGDKLRILYQT